LKQAGVYKKGQLSIDDILRDLKKSPDFEKVGAVGVFIGVVRGKSLEGQEVTKLEIEAYEDKADSTLSAICTELKRRKGIVDVRIYHSLGEFVPGDDLIYAVVAGRHREDVFRTLREAVERYKHEAPIFKREYLIDGVTGRRVNRWVEEKSLK
jgi:molybdopterin synthase catalytic subunit